MDALDSLIAALPGGTVSTHHGELAVHARDRWALAVLRDRRGDRVPPAVALAFPKSTEDVAVILRWAEETGTPVVTRGGATGRSGGAQAVKHSIVVDLSRMNRIVSIDDVSQTVTVEAGVRGNELEAALARRGLTTGHDVGLMELSTVGGWIASASAGTASAGYGTVGDLLIGLTVALPGGAVLEARAVPRTGAGPDLRRLFIGSEGILGIITLATLRASRLPTGLSWEAFRPQSFETGAALVREIMQRGYHPLVIQLMDGAEAASAIQAAHYEGGALVVVGFDTAGPAADTRRMELKALARDLGARPVGADAAESWWDHRHDGAEAAGEAGALGPGAIADSFDVAAVWRFEGMPPDFHADWLRVAAEESFHFTLLADHLASLGLLFILATLASGLVGRRSRGGGTLRRGMARCRGRVPSGGRHNGSSSGRRPVEGSLPRRGDRGDRTPRADANQGSPRPRMDPQPRQGHPRGAEARRRGPAGMMAR